MKRVASILALCIGLIPTGAARAADGPDGAFFERQIRPVLMDTCFKCHGGEKVESGFRVDGREKLLTGGRRGPAVVPGEPDRSLLIQAVRRTHEEVQMPPEDLLPDRTVRAFERWVAAGAKWPQHVEPFGNPDAPAPHWAFEPIEDARPPEDPTGWAKTPIDRFIAARYRAHDLEPVDRADKRTLIRRAWFDLIGLPPDPDAVDRFVHDTSTDAFAKVIDRLLDSPRYGERWGRHWLDLARYADTSGDAADAPIPEARLYRNYVIDAFNEDLPYDRFIKEQIAGDILAEQQPDHERNRRRRIATGFVALSRRFGNRGYSDMHLVVQNSIDTIGKSMLGMSMSCARCHDHKFDPITQADYYGMYGYFKSTDYPHVGTEHTPGRRGFVPLTDDPDKRELYGKFDDLRWKHAGKKKGGNIGDDSVKQKLQQMKKKLDGLEVAYAVQDKPADEIGDAKIQKRGTPGSKGEKVARGFIERITPEDPDIPEGRSGRLILADWIASPDNPLTARVMVNRIWQYHFGRGLVTTSSTFGAQGKPPTHPKLLDYLARRFIEDGWSIKSMHRRIMRSKVYQLAGRATDSRNRAEDATNRWYWHYPRRRLEAEPIRDAVLAISGRLDASRPGPHPFPEPGAWKQVRFTQHNPFKKDYRHNHRSVYLMQRRLGKHPFLKLFNGANPNSSDARRSVSTVPLQSLFWMNSPFVRDSAEALAERLLEEAGHDEARLRRAYMLAYSRPPSEAEVSDGLQYLREYRRKLSDGLSDRRKDLRAWMSVARLLLSSNEFVYLD